MVSILIPTILLCLGILGESQGFVPRSNSNPSQGKDQVQTLELLNKIFGKSSPVNNLYSYNHLFRPPSISEGTEGPDPTVVEVSFRKVKITDYNETDGTIKLNLDAVKEFTDSRLAFDAPSPDFILDLSLGAGQTLKRSVWNPPIRLEGAKFSLGSWSGSLFSNLNFGSRQVFLNPNGRICTKDELELSVKSTGNNQRLFSFKLVDQLPAKEMLLQWNEDTPFTLAEKEVELNGIKYDIVPEAENCRYKEDVGSFVGTLEYGCIQFSLKLIPVRQN